MNWTTICNKNDILLGGGRCALVDGKQVAIFRLSENSGETLYAIANFDPFSKANVLSRGIAGCVNQQPVVASPIYKQHFNLITGQCLEDESVTLETWHVQLDNDMVQLASKQESSASAA